jgi:2-C-methyl-D-erythritol 4-phosphate cytidylyltransferase
MGASRNKVFLPLAGKPVLVYTLEALERASAVDEVLLVAHRREVDECRALVARQGLGKVVDVIVGGDSRHASEYCALQALRARIEAGGVGTVLIHDGARPFVAPTDIERLVAATPRAGGALLATPLAEDDLVVEADDQGNVTMVFPTEQLWRAQTPQAFDALGLLAAYDAAAAEGYAGTDTASSVERAGGRVHVVAGSESNIKLTTPQDLLRAEALVRPLP